MNRLKLWLLVQCVLLIALVPVSAGGQEPAEEAEETLIEPYVIQLLKDTGEVLHGATSYSFHAEIMYDEVTPSGQKLQFTISQDVSVRRPDRLYVDHDGDLRKRRIWYNGETLTVYNVDLNLYGTLEVPPTIDEMLEFAMDRFGVSLPLSDLVFSEPHAVFLELIEEATYVGLSEVEGMLCHHVAIREENIDWQIWIEDAEQPLPRKVVITYKDTPSIPQFIAVLSQWDMDARLSDDLFEVDLPEGSERIDFLPVSEYETGTEE